MITLRELNPHDYPVTVEILANLNHLLFRINEVRSLWGKPMIVTSGLRSQAGQELLIAEGKSKATKSKHLTGQACDIYDPEKLLAKWCLTKLDFFAGVGLWLENPDYTKNWVHFQSVPPKSGSRIFIP